MKKPILLILSLFLTLALSAERISEQQALQLAQQFMQGKAISTSQKARRVKGVTTRTPQNLYVFNVEGNGGFVIVSGDDRTDAILGYSTSGSYDEADIPANLRLYMNYLDAEIASLQSVPETNGLSRSPQRVPVHAAITPLLVTEWDQGNWDNDINSDGVYNSKLPKIGGACPCTGCVATVAAQLMYYYKWPAEPISGVPGYVVTDKNGNPLSGYPDTSADLPGIQFQWSKMKPTYDYNDADAEAVDAVADLMLYSGYAAQMEYGVDGSAASKVTLAKGMATYFGYNPNTWKNPYRYEYGVAEWDALMYNELEHKRPIIFSGSGDNGGHAFICDGYDGEGLYHFNWGWGGKYNGYYRLAATNPYGTKKQYTNGSFNNGYILNIDCIIGLQPDNSDWPAEPDPNADDTWELTEITGTVATANGAAVDGTIVKIGLYNYNTEACAFGYGMAELMGDGTLNVLDTSNEYLKNGDALGEGWGYPALTFNFSSYNLPEGKHTIVPVSILNGETEWRRCKPSDCYFEVNVEGGKKTITAHPIESLQINSFEVIQGPAAGSNHAALLSITNNGDNLEKDLYVFVGESENMRNNKLTAIPHIKIAAGNTKEYRLSLGKLATGTNTVWLAQYAAGSYQIISKKQVTISSDLAVSSFDITGKKLVDNALQVDVAVKNNSSNDYTGTLFLFANNMNTKKYVYETGAAIEAGATETSTFYFRPTAAGTWNIWVATDRNGNNVIGETTVEVTNRAEAKLDIALQVLNLKNKKVKDVKMTLKAEITNKGEAVYDDMIGARLCKRDNPNSNSATIVEVLEKGITLEPGATGTLEFDFSVLESGSEYFLRPYYYTVKGSNTVIQTGSSVGYYKYYYGEPGTVTAGDANDDYEVDAADVTEVINNILGKTSTTFVKEGADINSDGVVDVFDLTKIISVVLASTPASARAKAPGDDKLTIDNFNIAAGETKEFIVSLTNNATYAAFQFDLQLPEGIGLDSYSVNPDRIPENTEVKVVEQSDGTYRFLAAPMSGEAITGNSGAILKLKVSAAKSIEGGVKNGSFANVKLSNIEGEGATYDEMPLMVMVVEPAIVIAKSYTRKYGDENPTFEYEVVGGDLGGTPEIICEATPTSPVGTYDIIIKQGSVTNTEVTYVNSELTVEPALLKVSAGTYEREEGQENPEFQLLYEGWKNNEDESVLITKPTATTEATAESPAGIYDIIVTGGEAQNYAFEYVNGVLVVTQVSGIAELLRSGQPFDVFLPTGQRVATRVTTLKKLPRGFYIVGGKKIFVR